MVFLCACIHPDTQNESLSQNMPSGYWLTEAELRKMAPLASGIPLTFEHAGISKAVESVINMGYKLDTKHVRYELEKLRSANPATTIVGTVTAFWKSYSGAWWINIHLKDEFEAVLWLVERCHVRGVSLTHIEDRVTNEKIPLEVSLCKVPARPTCYVYKAFKGPFDAMEYMRSMQKGSIKDPSNFKMSSELATSAIPEETSQEVREVAPLKMSRIEQALSLLTEENRKVIEDRLIAASSNMQKAIDQMQETKRLSNITESNLKSQVGVLKAHIDPEVLTNCHIDNETYLADLYSDNANDVRRTLDRVLIAANMTLMNYKNKMYQASSGSKRARIEEPVMQAQAAAPSVTYNEPEPETNMSAPVCNERDSALLQAMSDTFEIM